jgi:signal transduction histidine kinase
VSLQSEAAADFSVEADPDQLHRILVNLFRNAREAIEHPPEGAPRRKGRLKVSADTRGGFAVVTVADNGPGVSERARERLFQPFGTGRAGGTGLGLTIARDLARGHGGELELTDTGPEGTTFELRLPAA